jgi:hypothetical protein
LFSFARQLLSSKLADLQIALLGQNGGVFQQMYIVHGTK